MNTDASSVEDINILMKNVCCCLVFAPFEQWSNIFRTQSFTLSKNDLDPNDISDSVSSSPMTNCCAPR